MPTNFAALAAVAPLLDCLRGSELAHAMPGRVRLRLARASREDGTYRTIREAVSLLPGIRRVEARPAAGSVLIEFDPSLLATGDLLDLARLAGVRLPAAAGPASRRLEGNRRDQNGETPRAGQPAKETRPGGIAMSLDARHQQAATAIALGALGALALKAAGGAAVWPVSAVTALVFLGAPRAGSHARAEMRSPKETTDGHLTGNYPR